MYYKFNKKIALIYSFVLAIILIALDQFTKLLAKNFLMNKPDFIIIDGVFQLHYLENNGAAFSMLAGKQFFFLIITPIMLLLMIYILIKMPQEKKFSALNYIIVFTFAGALGNYIDRFSNRYVIDFLYFSLIDFPVFNVADIYVTCSVFLLILLILFCYKDQDFEEIFASMKRK